jgi:hypothetical protein
MSAPLVSAVPTLPTQAAGSQGFVIAGNAYSYDSVARLLSRLALVPDLSEVSLTNSSSGAAPGSSGSSAGVQFNISAEIKGAPAPAPAPVAPAPAPATTTAVSS